jgi:hypothetical protein
MQPKLARISFKLPKYLASYRSGTVAATVTLGVSHRAAIFPGCTNFGHWMPRAPTFLDTLAKWSLKRRQHLAGRPRRWAVRPHLRSIGPGIYATSSPHVIFSVTMPYFEDIEDMHGFWSIRCFFIIRCS